MAKLTVTVAVLLFVLALAQARIPSDHTENDVIAEDVSTNVQESDSKTAATWPKSVLLPSQKLESETETNDFLPLTVVNFHPINRHFRHHPSLTFRHRRPCHHHRLAKPWGLSRFHHREMTYGNDMLVSKGDGKEEIREIPANWLKFPHDDDVARKEGFVRPHHHHLHHFHRDDVAEGDKESAGHEHEQEQEQQTGFMTKIRKFLNHF